MAWSHYPHPDLVNQAMGSADEAWSAGYDGQSYGDAAVGWQHQHQHPDQHQLMGQVPPWVQQANSQMPNWHYMPNRQQQQQQHYRQYRQYNQHQAYGMGCGGRFPMNERPYHQQHQMEEYWPYTGAGASDSAGMSSPEYPGNHQKNGKNKQKNNANNGSGSSNKISQSHHASSVSEEGTASTEQPTPQPKEASTKKKRKKAKKAAASTTETTTPAAALATAPELATASAAASAAAAAGAGAGAGSGSRQLSPEEILDREALEAAKIKEKMEAGLAKFFDDDSSDDDDKDDDDDDESESSEGSDEEDEEESEDDEEGDGDEENEPEAEHRLDGIGASNSMDDDDDDALRTMLFPDQQDQHYQGAVHSVEPQHGARAVGSVPKAPAPATSAAASASSAASAAALAAFGASARPSPESPLSFAELADGARLGNIFADKLQLLPLPGLEEHLSRLFEIMHRCLTDLYAQRVTPTVIAMQNHLQKVGAPPSVVQAVLPICARKKRLFQIFVPKDCNTCVLLLSEPLEKAFLHKATYAANYRPEFLDALREVLQAKAAGKGIQAGERGKWSLQTASTAVPSESHTHLSLSNLL